METILYTPFFILFVFLLGVLLGTLLGSMSKTKIVKRSGPGAARDVRMATLETAQNSDRLRITLLNQDVYALKQAVFPTKIVKAKK